MPRLNITSSPLFGFKGLFFGAMGSNPAIQYVAPNGNDAASGADWTNAKQTILAAYDALPSTGGTVYIAHGSFVGGEVASQGIWIVGANDPLFNTPLTGWRQQKTTRFVGVGRSQGIQFSLGNPVGIYGGQPPDVGNNGWGVLNSAKPAIWLAGTTIGMWFENLSMYPMATAIRLGIRSDQSSRDCNTAQVMFRNVAAQVLNNGGGPVVDVGYAFWVYWEDCVLIAAYNDSGGTPLALTDDKHAVMLLKPEPTGETPGLFTIRNNRWAAGGLKYTAGGTGAGSLYIEDVLVEGNFTAALPPVVWITNGGFYSGVVIRGVSQADNGAGSMPTVQIDAPVSVAEAITCIGVAGTIQGPCMVLSSGDPHSENLLTVSPLRSGQIGIAGGRLTGQHDSARRRFSPTTARFTNLGQQDVSLWSGLIGSATVTTGQTAPDGTTNAALLTSAGGLNNKQAYRASRTYAVGDVIVYGGWLRATTPVYGSLPSITWGLNATGFSYASLKGLQTLTSPSNSVAAYPFVGDGEWTWVAQAVKITVLGTNPADTVFAMQVQAGCPTVFYAPIFLHIPTGTISDNEAAELVTHLQSWSNAATVGHISPLKGEVINAIGGLATITKAGAPVDGDYATPVDGLIVTDTTNNKIWTRIGGVWKGVAVS